jgi:hypothetical protein
MKQTSRIFRPSHSPCSAPRLRPDPADPAIRAVAGKFRHGPWREQEFEPVDPEFDEDGVDELVRRNFESAGESVDPEPQ